MIREARLLTLPQVIYRTNLSRSTIYNLINAGKLKAIKIGRSVRIYERDLDAYIESII